MSCSRCTACPSEPTSSTYGGRAGAPQPGPPSRNAGARVRTPQQMVSGVVGHRHRGVEEHGRRAGAADGGRPARRPAGGAEQACWPSRARRGRRRRLQRQAVLLLAGARQQDPRGVAGLGESRAVTPVSVDARRLGEQVLDLDAVARGLPAPAERLQHRYDDVVPGGHHAAGRDLPADELGHAAGVQRHRSPVQAASDAAGVLERDDAGQGQVRLPGTVVGPVPVARTRADPSSSRPTSSSDSAGVSSATRAASPEPRPRASAGA